MKTNAYTGTFLSQRAERLAVRKRFAEIAAKRGMSRQVTFREIVRSSAKEKQL